MGFHELRPCMCKPDWDLCVRACWHLQGNACWVALRVCAHTGMPPAGVPGTALPGGFQQFNCIVNTVLSLLGATVVTFIASAAVHNKFDMVRPAQPLADGARQALQGCFNPTLIPLPSACSGASHPAVMSWQRLQK